MLASYHTQTFSRKKLLELLTPLSSILKVTMKQSSNSLSVPAKIEYALLALLELASQFDKATPLRIHDIAGRQPIPERYLEQIFNLLRRGGLVQGLRGAKGGYTLTREPRSITIAEIVTLITGEPIENRSSVNLERELLSEVWKQAQTASHEALQRCTLEDLVQRCAARKQKSSMFYI
ncbi:BadM/Rrf2 family transcriptional regulator [Leptolyngbya boryana NIES-2135]|uniref:BadM/Rrf2 family transcriptional regulator n=2 Tax=Leptolyngbya boryana TaxID=1184 RepID=A0A1Z4J943_LEPBY|nr:BadM/Rrf2 family transcriptional regulator [Leptolyngbya boryana NIES-2135]